MATLEQIQAKMKKLQTQAEELLAKKSQSVLSDIRSLMEKHGLTTADIDTHTSGKKRGPKASPSSATVAKTSVVQYQDTKTGATWSGRGRAPGWIAKAKDRSRFLIKSSAASTAPVVASKPKTADNYPRGPQPAKYRDPKSGATWSGRGPAPTWLAGVKDRNKFLIDVKTGSAQPVEPKVASQPVSKKTSTEKSQAVSTKIGAKKGAASRGAVKAAVAMKLRSAAPQAAIAQMPALALTKKVGAKKAGPTKPVVKKARGRKTQIPLTSEATISQTKSPEPQAVL